MFCNNRLVNRTKENHKRVKFPKGQLDKSDELLYLNHSNSVQHNGKQRKSM